jgi:hypothetical protein
VSIGHRTPVPRQHRSKLEILRARQAGDALSGLARDEVRSYETWRLGLGEELSRIRIPACTFARMIIHKTGPLVVHFIHQHLQ